VTHNYFRDFYLIALEGRDDVQKCLATWL